MGGDQILIQATMHDTLQALGADADFFVTSEADETGSEILRLYDLAASGASGVGAIAPVTTWKVWNGGY